MSHPISPNPQPDSGDTRMDVGQLTRLSILIKIGQALAANLELEPLLETVHREVGRLFDTTNFFIALCRAGAPDWISAYHIEHGQRQPAARHRLGSGFTGHILRTGRPLLFTSVADMRGFLDREGVVRVGEPSKSWMGVPLVAGETVVGSMAIQNYEAEGVYTTADLELFSTIASQLAVAVRNAQLYEDAQKRARELDAIAATGRDINSSLDITAVLGRIADSVLNLLTRDSVAIFFDEEGQGTFKAAAVAGAGAEELRSLSFRLGSGILGSIAANGKAEILDDAAKDPRAVHIAGSAPEAEREKLMAAPLFTLNQVVGVIGVWRSASEPSFGAEELDFLQGIGRQASVAIRNAQLFGQAEKALAEAEKANQAKSAFLASMSHELRTPLNAILLYSELLMDEAGDRGLTEMKLDLDRIQGAGRHLLGLIDDILDLSKIEAGRMTVYLEDCDIPALLTDIVSTLEPLVAKNRNRLVVDADPALTVIHSDGKKLRQTIYNLLSNAAKFTQDGTITLELRRDAETPGHACFTVKDTGIGLSPEQVERVFQEFSQAEESTSRNYGGTGLGLTLCRRFTDLLGGEIGVSSAPGQGATFRVRLPGLPPDSVPDITRDAARRKVLIIDDDASVRDAVSRMLEKEGFQVAVARDGAEGLAMARSMRPGVITLDIAMPDLDGWEVLGRLKGDADLKDIPVVLMTILDDRSRAMALDVAEYLQKPVTKDRLLEVVFRLLRPPSLPVLVVEDDEATREGIRRSLEGEGIAVRCAENGEAALDSLRCELPGMVLLDLLMPELDGFGLLEALQGRQDWRRVPVVVLTSLELNRRDRERLSMPQVQQVFRKGGYSRENLVDLVRRIAADPGAHDSRADRENRSSL